MEEKCDWKHEALTRQLEFLETLGSRPYDEIGKQNLFLLMKKVGFATCGKPCELPHVSNLYTGYKKETLEIIKLICNQIIKTSHYDPIRFACTILILNTNDICETAVFRIVTESGNIFIDTHARVYSNWECFMEGNKLPECEYCYPLGGVYNAESSVNFEFAMSPASSTGVYGLSKSFFSLNGLSNPVSVMSIASWMLPVGGTLATASSAYISCCATSRITQSIVESGKNASATVYNGFGFVDRIISCSNKHKKLILTKKDGFELSCELLFLFNAIASTRASNKLVHTMSVVADSEALSSKEKSTTTQKRNLWKRAANKRVKVLSPIVLKDTIETPGPILTFVSEEPSQTSDSGYKNLNLLLSEAVRAYDLSVEEIIYSCQSIFHDIMSWKNNEILPCTLIRNLTVNLERIYNDYQDVADTIVKIMKYVKQGYSNMCISVTISYEKSKSIFLTQVNNMEDQLAAIISDAEKDIIALQERLKIETVESTSKNNENFDESELSPEAQNLLSACENVIANASLNCFDLQEFGNILNVVKFEVVVEFKKKVLDYMKCLEDNKSSLKESFDINEFNESFGIKGNVGKYFFNETLQSLTGKRMIYKIKIKCRNIENEKNTLSVLGRLRKKMCLCYSYHEEENLSTSNLLSDVSGMSKLTVSETNCEMSEDKNVIMIELTSDQKIVVYVMKLENIALSSA